MPASRRIPILRCRLPPEPLSPRISHSSAHLSGQPLLAALFNQFCDQAGPAGLMTCAEAGAVVAMKIFVEKDEVAPVRIALEEFQSPCHRAPPFLSAKENMGEPPGNSRGSLP